MEDNELGLEYGINFNVKKGGERATKEIEEYNSKWEKYLQENPLKIYFGDGFAKSLTNDFQQATKDIKHDMSEINKLSVDIKTPKDTKWQKNIDDRVNAVEAMKKRLASIYKEMEELEYDSINTPKKKGLRHEDQFRLDWIKELKNEAEGLKQSISALENINLDADPQNFASYIKSLTQQNVELERMKEHYKQVGAEAKGYMNSLVGRGEMQKIFSMSEKDPESMAKKIDALVAKYKELEAAKKGSSEEGGKAAISDNRVDVAINRTLKEYERLRSKLNDVEEKKRKLDAAFSSKTLDQLLDINPTSLSHANDLMTELAKRKKELSFSDEQYEQNLKNIAFKEKQIAQAVREKTGAIASDAGRIQRTNQEAASVEKLNQAYSRQGNIISNLKGLASQYISIYATGRLIKNLTEVTGMFELQEKSLEAIIRNKQQADQIFSQTKALAVESPFQFKDLIGYVKQLSAYRIETDQLYDTMKNLADVSAGLGVDMNRIILAYGQVKSAAVLRGQELRQFTEAGIPLVQELADKFSELEKRTVSMNEVFSLISARQVPFEMVRDIFADMTKEGGMFYNMQKIQAETLSGKISNLKDAFDIMFNSIGSNKEVNFILKGTVDAIMNMAKNWKIVGSAMFPLITAFGAYRLTMAGLVAIENIRLKQSAGMIKLYNGELLAISKKSAAERASLATSRAIILQDTLRNTLEKEGIRATKARRIAYTEKIAMERTGMNIGKVVIAQEALKTKLMESGISATRANIIAQRSYQAAVMGASTATKGLIASMKALFVTNSIGWITLIIGALFSLGLTIANTIKETKKLKKELESIGNSGATEMAALEKRYTTLTNIVRSTTKSELEKAKAMESLKNKYSEIIPASKLTAEYISDEANSYQDAIKSIREYMVEKTKEKKISALDQDYDEKSNKYMSGMQKQLVKLGSDAESATMFVDELQRKLIELDIQDYSTSLDTTLKLMKDIYGYNLVDGRHLNANEQAPAVKFMKSYKDFFDKTKEYNNGIKSVLKEGATYYQENSKEYKKMLNDIEEAKLKFKQGNEKNGIKLTAYEFDRANAKIEQDHLIKYLTNTVKVAKDAMTKAVEEQDFRQIQTLMLDNFGKGLASKIQSLYPDKYTNEVNSYLLSNGIKDDRYLKKVNETPDDYASALEDQKKVAETKLQELGRMNKKIREEKEGFIDAMGQYKKASYEEEKAYWENELKAPKLYAQKYGKDWFEPKAKPTSGSVDNTDYVLERIKREIEMMEQAKKTYEDLVESGYSAVDAMIKVEKLYKGKIGDYTIADTYEETLANYRKAIDNLKKRPKTGDDIFGMEKKILETEISQTKKTIDDYIENINKTFQNNKNRINLFDVLFESTGNYGLASMIAQDLYGKGGVQIKTALREAVKQSLVGTEINMSDIVDANDEIDLNKAFEAANKLTGSALQKSLLENLNSVREYKEKEIEEFYKGYEAFQDYEKRKSDVVMKEMKYRYDISNSTLPDSEKSRLIGVSEKREKEGVSKIDLEQFKESDTWLRAFGDLDKLSIDSINRLKVAIKDYLETYRSELSATDLKTISDKLIELDEATTQIDLKQTFMDIFTKIDMTTFDDAVNKAKADVLILEAQVQTLQQKNTEANAAVKNKDGKDNEAEITRQKQLADQLADALERLAKARKELGIAEENQNKASNTQTKGLEKLGKEVANVSGYMTKLKGAVDGVVDAFKESAESMGFEIGEETLAVIDGINAGLSASISIIAAVAAAIVLATSMVGKALLANPILLAIAGGIALIVGIVSTINKLSLAKHKKEMEAYTKKIEELDKAYQRLKESGEYAFGDDMVKNRVSQVKKANEMVLEAEKQFIAASRNYHEKRASGKGEDKAEEEMEEYKKRYEDAQKELAESRRQLVEDISGLDMGSAARDFADSWLDAYLEFGNTADAIRGKFKDMIRNMVVNTILSKITDAFLKPIYTMIGDLSSDADGLTSGDINTVLAKLESGIPALDATLTATAEGLDNALGGLRNTDNDLQGISKGIAGASEETVGLLAGYMESIRFRLFAYIDYMMLNSGTTTMSSLLAGQNTQIVHLANIDANTLRSAVANEELTKEVKKLITTSGTKGAYSLNVNI